MDEKIFYYTKYAVALTFLLKDHPQAVLAIQYILWRKGTETGNGDGKWHFHVADIAGRLGKDERTVRKHLKPLVGLGLLGLAGEAGKQYYLFDDGRYAELLRTDPRTVTCSTPPKFGDPSQKMGGEPLPQNAPPPLPQNGSLKIAEEKTAEQSCPVGQDGTGLDLVPKESCSGSFVLPHEAQAAPNGAPFAGLDSGILEQPPRGSAPSGTASSPSGEALPRTTEGDSISGSGCGSARPGAATRVNGHARGDQGSFGKAAQGEPSRPVYEISGPPIPLPLPNKVPAHACAKRQDAIVRELNEGGFDFVKEGAMGSNFGGYAVCAYDTNAKVVLLTSDFLSYVKRPHVQEMCGRFMPQKWKVFLWAAEDGCLHNVARRKPFRTDHAVPQSKAA